jgi:SagB-type dehydrogenase family enzyme
MAWSWQPKTSPGAYASVSLDGTTLATLTPISPYFEPASRIITAERAYALSRFAYLHVEGEEMVLESPLAHARIFLHDRRAALVAHRLVRPRRVAEICGEDSSIPAETAAALLALFLEARMVSEVGASGTLAEADSAALQSWEFHDLLFHARSRAGRHNDPIGGTYRFLGTLDPPPVLKPVPPDGSIELYRPDLARLEKEDPPFAAVQEARRSIREYSTRPLTAPELGEFLYRVGRVADYSDIQIHTPKGSVTMAVAPRPYPAGGGLYELELYVTVNRCEGLDAGLYRYEPDGHRLTRLAAAPEDLEALLMDASHSTTIPRDKLQVLIVIAARFQRIAWKYASIAYSIILKDVGVLYQTMYLNATAMGLAPCGVGCGDADLFARAAGTDYYAETSVGEFLLGSRE